MTASAFILRIMTFLCICHAATTPMERTNRNDAVDQGFIFLSRQNSNGTCPNAPGRECGLDQICCPKTCCRRDFPQCIEFNTCVRYDGKSRCRSSKGETVLGVVCQRYGLCCGNPPYDHCTSDPPYDCVNKDGYLSCGDPPEPGVSCGLKRCCKRPQICCREGCCPDRGQKSSRGVAAPFSSVPGATPLPSGSNTASESPTPTPSEATEAPSAVPSESEIPKDSTSSDKRRCFPADATVVTEDRKVKTMEELRTGDRVLVSADEFSDVFMWTHRDGKFHGNEYIRLVASDGHSLTAALGHIVYVCRRFKDSCRKESIRIKEVDVGDAVWVLDRGVEATVEVLEKSRTHGKGLHNPHTYHGDIIVNGVLSTCYTRAVPIRAAHGALAPLRAFSSLSYRIFESRGGLHFAGVILRWLGEFKESHSKSLCRK